jgi:cytochrome c-type biogenesis protein CcmE
MKKTHIILLGVLAISIGVIVAMTGDYTTYGSFALSKANPTTTLNVVGHLNKDKEIIYEPEKNANYFEFTMNDKDGNPQIVYYRGAKPQDFERSEQLVVKGKMDGSKFHAAEILMKCPSKYNDDEIRLKESA